MRHPNLTSSTILVVEDEPLISMDISSALEDAGAAVQVASCVDEALFLADEQTFDGAVIDFSLGDRTAQSLCDVLVSSGVPIVIYTGSSVAIADPSISVLAKPAPAVVLVNYVERAIGDARSVISHRIERQHAG